jgi:hypothetical protein
MKISAQRKNDPTQVMSNHAKHVVKVLELPTYLVVLARLT